MVHYITDKEFVPTSISHCNPMRTDVEKGLYQLVYGVLIPSRSYDDIYDLVVRIINEHESMVVKRFYLDFWSKEVKAIIDRLNMIDKQGKRVLITIPFFEYLNDIPYTLNRFQFVKFAVDEILAKGEGQIEACDKSNNIYLLGELDEVFDHFWEGFERRLSKAGKDEDITYYHSLLRDELYRRGFRKVTELYFGEKRRYSILPSEYYNEPQRFLGILDLYDDYKFLKVKYEEEPEDDASDDDSEKNVNAKEMAGIVYFMLQDIFQETSEKKKKTKLVELFNFVLDSSFLGKKREPDTVRNYIDGFKRIPNVHQSQRFYDTVKATLNKYKFKVPEAIREATEITKKHEKFI